MTQNNKRIQIKFAHEPGVSEHHVKYVARHTLETQTWQQAEKQHNSTGLGTGIPDLQPTANAKTLLPKAGLYEQANIIDRIASGSMWSGSRLLAAYNSYCNAHPNVQDNLFDDTQLGRTKHHITQGITQH